MPKTREKEVIYRAEESQGLEERVRDGPLHPYGVQPERRRLEGEREGEGVLKILALPPLFVPLAAHCLRGSFEADGIRLDEEALMEHLTEIGLAVQSGTASLYAATRGSRALGIVEVREQDGPPLGLHYLLGRLFVTEAERGKGLARKLLRYALLALPARDVPVIFMSRGETLPRSYRRLGARSLAVMGIGSLLEAQAKLKRKWDG